MFDHLDDPEGFHPSARFALAVRQRGTRRRRLRRLALMGTTSVVCLVLVAGGLAIAADRRLNRVDRVEIGTTDGPEHGPEVFDGPFNVLVVGTDGRPEFKDERLHSDTMMVVRIDPASGRAIVLPLPRDLYVPIAGTNGSDRINQAIAGGAERLVATVEDLGVPIDHYVEIGFDGMRGMVDAVGGVDVAFPTPMRDEATGLSIAEPGCRRLDGPTTLALARARRAEQYVDGRWVADPRGDMGRIHRQVLLGRILLGVFSEMSANPGEIERLTRVFADHATVDAGLSNRDLLELARVILRVTPGSVFEHKLNLRPTTLADGREVLVISDEPTSDRLKFMDGTYDDGLFDPRPPAGGETTTTMAPGDVTAIGPC